MNNIQKTLSLLIEKKLTSYQKKHNYIKRIENKCNGNIIDGICEQCGRHYNKKGKHTPNTNGSLGYCYKFADGSEYISHNESDNI